MHAPHRPPGQLQIWDLLTSAYLLPLQHARTVAVLTWAWALVLGLGTGALYSLLDEGQLGAIQRGEGLGPASLNMVSLLTGLIVGSSVAVGWHRLLLLGETPPVGPYLRLDNTVWRYIAVAGLMLLLSLPFLASTFVMSHVAPEIASGPGSPTPEPSASLGLLMLALVAAMLLAFILTTRLSLVLPARAIDDTQLSLSDSWRLTRGHFWRLFTGTLVCYLPTLVAGGLITGIASGDRISGGAFILSTMLSSMAGLVTSVVPVGFLSLAYRELSGRS